MYAKVKNEQLQQYPYGYTELQADNPYTNFNGADVYHAFQGTEANLAGHTLENVVTEQRPEINERTHKATLASSPVLEDGQWVLKWSVSNKSEDELAQQDEGQANAVRAERNSKLAECDWTQLPDAPVNTASWAAYRQDLRDITAQPGFPWSVVWPTKPE